MSTLFHKFPFEPMGYNIFDQIINDYYMLIDKFQKNINMYVKAGQFVI